MIRFLHAADLHLDSPLKGLERYEGAPVDELRDAPRRALENLVRLALEEEVDLVLLAGDLYDGDWKDFHTGLFFVQQLNRLREAGVRVHLISGNHDAQNRMTRTLSLPDHVHHHDAKKPQTIRHDDLGVVVHGQSYRTQQVTEDLAAGYPDADAGLLNIGLLHTSLTGYPPHENYAPCSVDTLRRRGYAYWALGHVHARQVISEEPWIVYPGNIQGRHARETGAKGCLLVEADGTEITEVTFRPLDVVRWAHLEIGLDGVERAESVRSKVRDDLERQVADADGRLLAARLTLTGRTGAHAPLTADPERWISELRALATEIDGIWLEKIRLKTRRATDLDRELERQDAFGDLLRMIHDLEEGADLEALAAEVAQLDSKLPQELRDDEEPFRPTDPETLRALLPEVRDLLLDRLLSHDQGGAGR